MSSRLPIEGVSIVIPLFRRSRWIGENLAHLARQRTPPACEVIFVDDGSPNSAELERAVRQAEGGSFPVRFLNKAHAGPAAARNYGVAQAIYPVVAFLDDDSLAAPGWLAAMAAAFAAHPQVGLVSGATLARDRSSPLMLALEKAVYHGKSWATCNIAYRRDVFDALGGFDETYPEASWEDNDLGLRARWQGYQHLWEPRAVVYHNHEESLAAFRRKCLLNGRGAARFFRKHLFRRPLWALATPCLMARRLAYAAHPAVWRQDEASVPFLRFTWSLYSLKGFYQELRQQWPAEPRA